MTYEEILQKLRTIINNCAQMSAMSGVSHGWTPDIEKKVKEALGIATGFNWD